KSACQYPLIIKHLWHAPLLQAADQEIVYRDLRRFTYREFRERVGRLASALAGIGIRPGDTVGVLDWDSNRFLEAFFAVPMMGAVLQTVNVRLPPAGGSPLPVRACLLRHGRAVLPRRRLYADDAHVSRARVGIPVGGDACRGEAGLPRPL